METSIGENPVHTTTAILGSSSIPNNAINNGNNANAGMFFMKLNIGDSRSFIKSLIQHNDAISIPKVNDIDIAMKVILIEYNAFSFSVSVFKIDNALSNIFPNFGNAGTGFM